jgi:hypothetical protein
MEDAKVFVIYRSEKGYDATKIYQKLSSVPSVFNNYRLAPKA